MIFILNQLDLSQILLQITPENLKVRERVSILRFSEVTFRNLSIFWLKFNLTDVITRLRRN